MIGTSSLSVAGPVWSLSAVAVLRKLPASRSAWVTTWVAGQVKVAEESTLAGWAGVQAPTTAPGSLTVTPVKVRKPVLVTTMLYSIEPPSV